MVGSRADPASDSASRPPLIVIGGATATGKTALSLDVAEAVGAEIISADSRQVYRGMDIGTAKIPVNERRGIAHHGLDLVDPDQPFTVADFTRYADAVLDAIPEDGPPVVMVGGTGLYLRAVARGLPIAESGHDPVTRARLEAGLAAEGLEALAEELREAAPDVAARTDLRNPRRVVRALERLTSQRSDRDLAPRGYAGPTLWLGLQAERVDHREAIDHRAASQFRNGLMEEAAALRARYSPTLRSLSAMGYREAFDVLDGARTVGDASAATAARTWAYARRQRTWFRSEPGVTWLQAWSPSSTERAVELVRRFLGA